MLFAPGTRRPGRQRRGLIGAASHRRQARVRPSALIDAGKTAKLDRCVGHCETNHNSCDALDEDAAMQEQVRNVAPRCCVPSRISVLFGCVSPSRKRGLRGRIGADSESLELRRQLDFLGVTSSNETAARERWFRGSCFASSVSTARLSLRTAPSMA